MTQRWREPDGKGYLIYSINGTKGVIEYREYDSLGRQKWRGAIKKGPYYFTPLRTCTHCNRMSTPKNIREHSMGIELDVVSFRQNRHVLEHFMGLLCTPCWNKLRPVYGNYKTTYQSEKLISKLERTIRLCQKQSTQPANSGNSLPI